MEIKILQVFYGKDGLPYKDKDRQVHFPIAGTGFLGASKTTKIKFYYDELDNLDETTWVAVSKLPNGKVGSRVLESYLDEELNEHYALLELDNYYTQYKGDVFISLQGYQGGVDFDYDEESSQYEIHGTPTIAATGSIKFTINYANQFVGSGETDNINFQRILAALGTKLGIRAYSEHVEELPSEGSPDVFYVVNDDPDNPNLANIYVWNGNTKHYIWVGDNTLDLVNYYTKTEGEDFEEEISNRINLQNQAIQSLGNLQPSGVDTSTNILAFTQNKGIYIGSDTGDWYYWNGTAYVSGGTYQATAIGENNVSAKELDTDVANCIAGNRPLITRQGGYLSKTDGTYKYANANHSISSKMLDCQPGDIFYYKGYGVADAGSVLFYNGSTYVNYAIYNSPNAYTMVVIPSGINKVIFSSFAANGTDVVFDLIKANITLDMLSQEIKDNLMVFTSQLGFLNKNNGNYSYTETYHSISSPLLSCKQGDIFFYKGKGESATASAIYYNGSTIVSILQINNTTGYTKVVVPSGVNKVIFSSYELLANPVVFDLVKFNIADYVASNISVSQLDNDLKGKVNAFTEQLGYLSFSSGNYSGTDSFHSISSVLLDCKPGDTYYYKGIGNLATASVIFYNGSSIVSYLQINSTNAYTPVIVPNGVNKVIFSSYAAIGTDVVFDLVKFNISKNISSSNLAQKKYVACGDSFTRGGSLPDGSSYPYLVANTKNMSLTLLAVNGGFIHYDISQYPNACFTNTSGSVNYTQIPEDADYITIAYGLNESSTPIGDKTSSDHSTIWGAFNEVLGWIIANRPKAKVGIIANDSWFTYTMRNTLKEIAAYWGVGFLDLKEYGKTLLIGGKYSEDGPAISTAAVNARNTLFQVSNEDAHPNADGHKARATIIAEWLETL